MPYAYCRQAYANSSILRVYATVCHYSDRHIHMQANDAQRLAYRQQIIERFALPVKLNGVGAVGFKLC